MHRFACLLLALAPACVAPSLGEDGEAVPIDRGNVATAVYRIAETFADLTTGSSVGPVHIGVVDFESSAGATLLGETLAHDLSGALAAALRRRDASATRVVTRHHMYEVVQEQDRFDRGPETLGRLVGADLLIMGRITPYRDEVHVSAQLLAVADGVVLGALREEFRRTSQVEALLVAPPAPSVIPPVHPQVATSATPATAGSGFARQTGPVDVGTHTALLACPPGLRLADYVSGESSFSRGRRLRYEQSESAGPQPREVRPRDAPDPGPAFHVEILPARLVASVGVGAASLLPRVTIVARFDVGGHGNVEGRRPTHVCLAVDLSGSMSDGRLADAVVAIRETLDVLGPRDWISIVGFSDTAYPLVRPVRATEQAKASVMSRMSRLSPGGNTDFEAALKEVSRCLRATRDEGLAHHAVLVSDGRPTVGSRTSSSLGQLTRRLLAGSCLDTIGVGDDFGRDTLQAMAREGHGEFHIVEQQGDLADTVVERVREATASPTVRASLTFTPAPDTAVVGSDDPWQVSDTGCWNTDLGALSLQAVVERRLQVHPALPSNGLWAELGEITLTWVDEHGAVQTRSERVGVDIVQASPLVSDA
jgi:Mg-chelatase subunit ChlD